ncbi:MAG: sodium:proton antiporter [Oscillospiraceae bacterium]|nr:sodium:proton antiporter [Oscillospiraceae bacterium]
MFVFNFILILLAAVLLSNLINHFLPTLSVPLVQIILGILIAVISYSITDFSLELEPELFFVLFLSPLVFQTTRTADKKTMQTMIKPIIMVSVVLVFITAIAVGYLLNAIIPTISLAAAFALAGALGPTDTVAVESVAHRAALPRRIVSILSGESIISDATGIVCFQFAIAAAATGSFNLFQGLGRFLILAFGGLAAGMVLTMLEYLLVRWLHSLNIHTVSLHIALGVMTPFIIYMVAEELGTSGILAVFSAGICHSLFQDKFNPEILHLQKANENVWEFLSFSLDGLVFVMLGMQLLRILRTFMSGEDNIGGWLIVGYVMLIFAAFAVIRFLWWCVMVRKKTYSDPNHPIGRIKSGIIFTVAGARGAVSMASVLSIPLFLSNGEAFPERDLIILIAGGVIIVSLLMTNFVLPLLAEPGTKRSLVETEREARDEILQKVVERLKKEITHENFTATQIIVRNYYSRLYKQSKRARKMRGIRSFRLNILLGEKEILLHMVEMGNMSKSAAERHIEEINKLINETGKKMNTFQLLNWSVRHFIESFHLRNAKPRKKDLLNMQVINDRIMRKNLNALNIKKDDPAYAIIAAEHEQVMSTRMGLTNNGNESAPGEAQMVFEVASGAFYMERVLIQQMMEAGRLSWKTAKEMQANLTLLEAQLQTEE